MIDYTQVGRSKSNTSGKKLNISGKKLNTSGKKLSRRQHQRQNTFISILALAFGIHYFFMANLGPWTSPTIANHMYVKAFISQLALTALLVWHQWHIYKNNIIQNNWYFNLPVVLFLGYFIWATLSIFWTVNPDFYVFKWMMIVTAAISFYICLQFDSQQWQTVFKSIVYAAFASAIVGFLQVYFDVKQVPQVSVPAGTFGNKNMLGQLMVLAFPLACYYFLQTKNRNKSIFYIVIATSLLLTLFHAQARATWLSIIIVMIVLACFLVFNKKNLDKFIIWNRQKAIIAIIALASFLTLINFNSSGYKPASDTFSSRFSSIIDEAGKVSGPNTTVRYMIWKACWEMIKDKPLMGSGLGGFFDNMLNGYKNYKSMRTFRAHNDYIETVVELGLIGFLLIFGGLLTAFYSFILLLKRLEISEAFLLIAVSAAAAGNLFNALFSFPYQLTMPLVTVSCYLAYIISLALKEKIFKVKKIVLTKQGKLARLVVAVAVCGFIWFVNIDWWQGYRTINAGMKNGSKPYKTNTLIFNQEQVPIMWAVGSALNGSRRYGASVNLMYEIFKRWPSEYVTLELHYIALMNLGGKRRDEAIQLAIRGLEQGKNGLFGFYQKLFNYYLSIGDSKNPKLLIDKIDGYSDEVLMKNPTSYDQLIMMAMKLGIDPAPYYQRLIKQLRPNANTESNMSIFYLSKDDRQNAVFHIKKLLEIQPNHHNSKAFNRYLADPNLKLNVKI